MTHRLITTIAGLVVFAICAAQLVVAQDRTTPETKIAGPAGLPIIVRMQAPYDADVPLQIVCYFERTATSDARLFGAPVELDKRLGGTIAALRERGEFRGDAGETFLLQLPEGWIKPKRLLLIGLGSEASLSLERMEAVGRTALREAVRLRARQVAFAPLIKDAGNNQLAAGDVENAVVRGMLLAYDTEKRLQSQGLGAEHQLEAWIIEAGPDYYTETIAGVKKAVAEAQQTTDQRSAKPYSTNTK